MDLHEKQYEILFHQEGHGRRLRKGKLQNQLLIKNQITITITLKNRIKMKMQSNKYFK